MSHSSVLERQVAGSLLRSGLSNSFTTMVVACSGGPDSTALLVCLNRLRTDHGLSLHVAHFNHDFRGAEADHDAAFVSRLADDLALPCSIDKQDPVAYQRARGISSFEQAAREMRYSFLSEVAVAVGASAVALGHTSDDQAETILMHVLRGSGLNGLRGMAEVADWPWPEPETGLRLFRPLLGVAKADTTAYCRDMGQTFREDSGNYMWRFTRNKVRLDLMPRLARDYNPRVRDALLRLSRAATDDADYIESQLDRCWPSIAEVAEDSVSLDVDPLSHLHPALQRQALRRAFAVAAGDVRAPGEVHLDAMLSLLRQGRSGRSIHLPRGVRAVSDGGVLWVGRNAEPPKPAETEGEYTIRVPSEPGEVMVAEIGCWRVVLRLSDSQGDAGRDDVPEQGIAAVLGREALGETVVIRTRRPGDRFQPSGMLGTKKLQDFFTDAKVPRSERDRVPLLVSERGIAWVAGHRVAEWAKARDGAPFIHASLTPAYASM